MTTRVCVIGAGPSGMAFLYQMETLRLAGADVPEIVCMEKQGDWGGLWNYSWRTGLDQYGEHVHGSMYRYLWSNGPKEASLELPDYTFQDHYGKSIPSFPPREVLYDYLKGRWNKLNLRRFIKFERLVREVKYCPESDNFSVVSKSLKSNVQHPAETFDYVINASGHFSVPNMPEYPGIDRFPGRVMHSHDFRNAVEFAGRRLLIIGSSYSAEDIALQCVKYGATKVTCSYRTAPMGFNWPKNIEEKPLLTHVEGATAHFKDGTKEDFDAIMMATGYQHYYPYLEDELRLKGPNVYYPDNMYKGTIWMSGGNNKMMYIGAQDQYYTFTMFDAQARWAAKYILGKIKLPSRPEMEVDCKDWVARNQELKGYQQEIAFQTEFVQLLATEGEYGADLDVSAIFNAWEEDKHKDVLSYRDKSHASKFTGEMSPVHHTTFMEALDDSMKCYLAIKE